MRPQIPLVTWRDQGREEALIDGIRSAYADIFTEFPSPPATKFVCVAPILDYWRLSIKNCRKNNVPHFSEWIGAELLKAIVDRGFLIFDLSNEGHEFEPDLFHEIERWTAFHGLPQERVAFVQQN